MPENTSESIRIPVSNQQEKNSGEKPANNMYNKNKINLFCPFEDKYFVIQRCCSVINLPHSMGINLPQLSRF